MIQYQSLRDIEQTLELFEVCVPVYFQIFNVRRSKMNSGFHRCRHKSSDQYIGLQVEYWCPFCEIQLLPQIHEDFSKYRWSETRILWNSNLVLSMCMSPRTSFLLAELADSPLRTSSLVLEARVSSCRRS